jgi:hypothetical protein
MKDFTRPRGRLRALPLAARVVYSVFLVFTLAGLAVSLWLGADMVGAGMGGLDEYYAGITADAPASAAPTGAPGPALDLPAELDAPAPPEPMALRKLLEVTHFHLFSMPVYLLILSHLFMLGRAGDVAKLGWITLATLGTAAHVVAPWIARAAATGAGALYALSGGAMLLGMLVMSLWPLYEMWAPWPAPGTAGTGQNASSIDS